MEPNAVTLTPRHDHHASIVTTSSIRFIAPPFFEYLNNGGSIDV